MNLFATDANGILRENLTRKEYTRLLRLPMAQARLRRFRLHRLRSLFRNIVPNIPVVVINEPT